MRFQDLLKQFPACEFSMGWWMRQLVNLQQSPSAVGSDLNVALDRRGLSVQPRNKFLFRLTAKIVPARVDVFYTGTSARKVY